MDLTTTSTSTTFTTTSTTTSTTASTTTVAGEPGGQLTLVAFDGFMGRSSFIGVIAVENRASSPVVLGRAEVIYRNDAGAVIDRDTLFNRIF